MQKKRPMTITQRRERNRKRVCRRLKSPQSDVMAEICKDTKKAEKLAVSLAKKTISTLGVEAIQSLLMANPQACYDFVWRCLPQARASLGRNTVDRAGAHLVQKTCKIEFECSMMQADVDRDEITDNQSAILENAVFCMNHHIAVKISRFGYFDTTGGLYSLAYVNLITTKTVQLRIPSGTLVTMKPGFRHKTYGTGLLTDTKRQLTITNHHLLSQKTRYLSIVQNSSLPKAVVQIILLYL